MAALLCESFGKLCSGCSHALCVPCQACCEGMGRAITSPFFPYIAVTVALCAPPVVWGIRAASQACPATWLFVNAGLCAIHLGACLYIPHKVQEDLEQMPPQAVQPQAAALPQAQVVTGTAVEDTTTKKVEEGKATKATPATPATPLVEPLPFVQQFPRDRNVSAASSMRRLKHVMCYDAGVAIYILVFVFWMFWQTAGLKSAMSMNEEDESCDQVGQWVVWSMICGFLYMMMVCVAFACSLLCLR